MKNNLFKSIKTSYIAKMVAIIAIVSVSFTSCNDDDAEMAPTQSIVALAQGNSDLSTLVTALTKYPDLVSTLSGNGAYTVFAPTNAAFAGLLSAIGQTSLDDIPESVLKSVLQYHVVTSGAVLSTQLTTGDVTTANGEAISVNVSSGVKLNSTVNVVTADVKATIGVVHVIDAI